MAKTGYGVDRVISHHAKKMWQSLFSPVADRVLVFEHDKL
jgi:hypothetical protein